MSDLFAKSVVGWNVNIYSTTSKNNAADHERTTFSTRFISNGALTVPTIIGRTLRVLGFVLEGAMKADWATAAVYDSGHFRSSTPRPTTIITKCYTTKNDMA